MSVDPRMSELVPIFERALSSSNPYEKLSEVMVGLLNGGVARNVAYDLLLILRRNLVEAGREDDDDIVMDVMDRLSDWCSPDQKI